ncbi:MAG: hypothetical protein LRZ93_00805 [Clostridiales bacterium]|nr:hypothetical protein [Clostridiales bacterium]
MYTGGGAAAAAAVIANAIKASGAIIDVEPEDFLKILAKTKEPLVVTAEGGVFKTNYKYITSYKGLFFHTKAKDPIKMPIGTELIKANSISIPD